MSGQVAGQLAGTGRLVRLALRRDRVRLPVWLVAVLGVVYASAAAVQDVYGTPEQRAVYARTIGDSPVSIVFSGPPVALDTLGGVTVFEVNQAAVLAVALMAIFLTVRHTRGEEQEGRTELLRAAPVGRFAPVAAALLVVSCACLLVGVGVAASLLALGLPAGGSLVYGASIAALGLVFTAVAACAAQVTEHARGALGLAGVVLAVSFLLRGAGDVAAAAGGSGPSGGGSGSGGAGGGGTSLLSWVSPIGWSQAVHAYDPLGGDRWAPLLLSLALSVVLVAAAGVLLTRRDLGAGLLQPRPGSAEAGRALGTASGLALRLQRGALLGWTAALFLGGLTVGSLGGEVRDLADSSPQLRDVLAASGVDIVDAYLGTVLLVLALVATGSTVGSVLRLRAEETVGRAELLLATGLSRWRWALGGLAVTAGGSALIVAAGGLGVGLAHAAVTSDAGQVPRLLGIALTYLPAALVLGAVGVLLLGWAPGAVPAAWAALALCFVIGWLGDLLDLPDAVADLSPFSAVPRAPGVALSAGPLAALTTAVLALAAAGLVGLRRRDIG